MKHLLFCLLLSCSVRGNTPEPEPALEPAVVVPPDPYEMEASRRRQELGPGWTVVAERPFVVVGNESPQTVRRRANTTVHWSVAQFMELYFDKEPTEIYTIWLYRDAATYKQDVRARLEYDPVSPYGFTLDEERAIFMDISTGGGTLIHEIVHPFMTADFPGSPSWFNEGLASLYEQSGEEDGHIHGYPNWRLPALQTAIREKKLPAFEWLFGRTPVQFYDEDPGTNYAQARYLCYHLQQEGLLTEFYLEFRLNHARDPTGRTALEKVLGIGPGARYADLAGFQRSWEAWVMGLRYP